MKLVRPHIYYDVEDQIWDPILERVGYYVKATVDTSVYDRVYEQVWDRVSDIIWDHLYEGS